MRIKVGRSWPGDVYPIAINGTRMFSMQCRIVAAMSLLAMEAGGGSWATLITKGLVAHSPWNSMSTHCPNVPTMHLEQAQLVARAINCAGLWSNIKWEHWTQKMTAWWSSCILSPSLQFLNQLLKGCPLQTLFHCRTCENEAVMASNPCGNVGHN